MCKFTCFYLDQLFEQPFAVFWSYSWSYSLVIFKEYQNGKQSKFFSRVIGSAYATHVVHQYIVVPTSVGVAYADIHSLLAMLILCVEWEAKYFITHIKARASAEWATDHTRAPCQAALP